ncbi:hypothetical protein FRB90_009205 [Tulasnella sp. 427]|nr:hypothetical protein FRB90_009205 [Tulasnella sp. 427]
MALPRPEPRPAGISLADLDSIPLFMRHLPEDDGSNNIALEALQSLVYEGSPDEQARRFKDQGNEYFRGKRFREASAYYTQGINVNPSDPIIQEALLLNRAACNLELKNFGMVLRDTSAGLMINPQSPKAYFRASAALVSLERYIEALDVCHRCLAFDPQNTSVRQQRDKIIGLKEAHEQKEIERQERLRKDREERRVMAAAFQALNLVVLPLSSNEAPSQWQPHFDPAFSGLRTSVTPILFPVFLGYPQYNQSDLITSFDPSATFSSHLVTMFPPTPGAPPLQGFGARPTAKGPDWDVTGEYTTSNLSIYAITHRRRLLKIGKRMTLRDACDAAAATSTPGERDGLELRDGSLNFTVLPKGEIERAWVDDYKRRRAAEGFQA